MKEIVINVCYGGFSLSHEGMLEYARLKGITLYPEKGRESFMDFFTYWTVPVEQRLKTVDNEEFYKMSVEDRQRYNKEWGEQSIYSRDIERDDIFLVQTVKNLGEKANGSCASLKVVEIPDGVEWVVEEYYGTEWVAEKHRTWR
jgi:hypothetical protein